MQNRQTPSKLYLVATPIGNEGDITQRAIQCLQEVDLVLCEEPKEGRKLLKKLDLLHKKELLCLNEHNEAEAAAEIVALLKQGKTAALFSDCGTPLFADPGTELVRQCRQAGIPVSPIPGASSLTAALSVSGLDIKEFHYAGFLPRQPEERLAKLKSYEQMPCPLVFYDTPYRLGALLKDIEQIFPQRRLVLCLALTKPEEEILEGLAADLLQKMQSTGEIPKTKEFVLLLSGRPLSKRSASPKKQVKTRKRK